MIGEIGRGLPSVLTENLALEDIGLSENEIRERMSGNLCRCGAYNGIIEAIRATYAEEGAEEREAAA